MGGVNDDIENKYKKFDCCIQFDNYELETAILAIKNMPAVMAAIVSN